MLRLRVPNGVLNSEQLRCIGGVVARYGTNGSADITTRQNIQLRGVLLEDLPDIRSRLSNVGLATIQSSLTTAERHRQSISRYRSTRDCRYGHLPKSSKIIGPTMPKAIPNFLISLAMEYCSSRIKR